MRSGHGGRRQEVSYQLLLDSTRGQGVAKLGASRELLREFCDGLRHFAMLRSIRLLDDGSRQQLHLHRRGPMHEAVLLLVRPHVGALYIVCLWGTGNIINRNV
jgi:hypothetical protein